jgi:hypothetical protein
MKFPPLGALRVVLDPQAEERPAARMTSALNRRV